VRLEPSRHGSSSREKRRDPPPPRNYTCASAPVTMLALGAPSCRGGHRCWGGGVCRLSRQGELVVDAPSTPLTRPFLISGLHVLRFLGMTSLWCSHSTYLRVDFLGGRFWAAVDRNGGLNRTPPRAAVMGELRRGPCLGKEGGPLAIRSVMGGSD
jgi:hypothetical protein